MSAPSGNWQLVHQGESGTLFINPKNKASSLSLVKSSSSAKPVHFAFENSRAKFQYKGPDGSPMTERALGIAELMAARS